MNKLYLVYWIFAVCLLGCNSTEPENLITAVISVLDVGCTEAWVNIKLQNSKLPIELVLKENDVNFLSTSINSNDTTIIIKNLGPGQTYKIKVESPRIKINSNQIEITTLDTTSHNFHWETFSFGEKASSKLIDIAIVNKNNIWAVGEIFTENTYTYDSNGVWQEPYNAVHWDGLEWELKRILVNSQGEMIYSPLYGVFALPDGEIVFSAGIPYLPEGDIWQLHHLFELGILNENDGSVYQIWGSSINNLYFAGNRGTIVHYNGNSWNKINSGIDIEIKDIKGDYNELNGEYEILALASGATIASGREILKLSPNNSEILNNNGINLTVKEIWFKSNSKHFIVGDGIYVKSDLFSNETWDKQKHNVTEYYTNAIEGTELNDLVICGALNEVLHFNGVSWRSYRTTINNGAATSLVGIDYKDNLCCITGYLDRNAIIYVGTK